MGSSGRETRIDISVMMALTAESRLKDIGFAGFVAATAHMVKG